MIAAAAVLALLVVTQNPETRALLLFVDSIGVDLFAAMCVLFIRHKITLGASLAAVPVLKGVYRLGPVPGFWPTKAVLTKSAAWSGYALAYPLMAASMAALCIHCATG